MVGAGSPVAVVTTTSAPRPASTSTAARNDIVARRAPLNRAAPRTMPRLVSTALLLRTVIVRHPSDASDPISHEPPQRSRCRLALALYLSGGVSTYVGICVKCLIAGD